MVNTKIFSKSLLKTKLIIKCEFITKITLLIPLFCFTFFNLKVFSQKKIHEQKFNGNSQACQWFNLNEKIVFFEYNRGNLFFTDGTENQTFIFNPKRVQNFGNSSNIEWINKIDSLPNIIINKSFESKILLNNLLLFIANDGMTGEELWLTDGTIQNTKIVMDIFPGANSSEIEFVGQVDDKMIFLANNGVNGKELMSTDGTNIFLLRDINLGLGNINLFDMKGKKPININGKLVFSVEYNGEIKLISTDGLPQNTAIIDNVNNYRYLIPIDYLNSEDLIYIRQIYSGGLEFVKYNLSTQISTVINNMSGRYVDKIETAVLNNKLFFALKGYNPLNNNELYCIDGLLNSNLIFKDINPNGSSEPSNLTILGNKLVFAAYDPTYGKELWVTDGTFQNTFMLKDLIPNSNINTTFVDDNPFIKIQNNLFFKANDGFNEADIWKTDGTSVGTSKIKHLVGDTKSTFLQKFQNSLVFASYSNSDSVSLFFYNNNTQVLKKHENKIHTNIQPLLSTNTYIYGYSYLDSLGFEPVRFNENEIFSIKDISKLPDISSGIINVNNINEQSVFEIEDPKWGHSLFKYSEKNGLKKIYNQRKYPLPLYNIMNVTFLDFRMRKFEIIDSNIVILTLKKSLIIVKGNNNIEISNNCDEDFVIFDNKVIFYDFSNSTLWEVNLSNPDNRRAIYVTEFTNGNSYSTGARNFFIFNNEIFFTGTLQIEGTTLLKINYDFTSIIKVLDFDPLKHNVIIDEIFPAGSNLFYMYQSNSVVKINCINLLSNQNIYLLDKLNPNQFQSNFKVFKNKFLIFWYMNSYPNLEPWISDGTIAGTHVIKDLFSQYGPSGGDSNFSVVGDKFYFATARDDSTLLKYNRTPYHPYLIGDGAIWESDGTEAGTKIFYNNDGGLFGQYLTATKKGIFSNNIPRVSQYQNFHYTITYPNSRLLNSSQLYFFNKNKGYVFASDFIKEFSSDSRPGIDTVNNKIFVVFKKYGINEISIFKFDLCYNSVLISKTSDQIATIKSIGTIESSRKYDSINSINYQSSKNITLKPGFEIPKSKQFEAKIGNCFYDDIKFGLSLFPY